MLWNQLQSEFTALGLIVSVSYCLFLLARYISSPSSLIP